MGSHMFLLPRDTLQFSFYLNIHTHIHTCLSVLFLCRYNIKFARVLRIFPLATDSMPAPLIRCPTCTIGALDCVWPGKNGIGRLT